MAKTKKKVMRITRERALKLFSYFNYKTAGKWNSKRMEGKLMKLPESVDIKLVKNSKVKAILKEIINASSVEVISAVDEVISAVNKEKAKTKSTKKKKVLKKTTAGPVSKKKETKKKAEKKKVVKKKAGKSNKEKVYERFLKVKPDKALDYCEKWWKEINKEVQLTTIRSWVSQWRKGKALPACVKKGKQK